MPLTVLQVGAGGFGERWCQEFLPTNVRDGLIEVVGLTDKDPDALRKGQELLGLPDSACFTDLAEAFQKTIADFCTVVIPPAYHETVVDLAIARGFHILSEKPIANTIEASARIVRKVKAAGLKMAVTMSHRFDQDKQTLADVVRSGHLGRLNMLSCRLSADFRVWDNWRRFRHEMAHPLLIEGAVHHLDILASLVDSPCKLVYATTWRPEWAAYAGDTDGVVVLTFENGVRAVFEGSVSAAVGVSDWYFERIRADGSDAIAILDNRELELFNRMDHRVRQRGRSGQGQKSALLPGTKWINNLLIEKFVCWLSGGPQMETHAEANLASIAIMFAAVESSMRGEVVEMKDYLSRFAQE
jgi:predicted dehydrogenase